MYCKNAKRFTTPLGTGGEKCITDFAKLHLKQSNNNNQLSSDSFLDWDRHCNSLILNPSILRSHILKSESLYVSVCTKCKSTPLTEQCF